MNDVAFFHEISEGVYRFFCRKVKFGLARLNDETLIDTKIHCTENGEKINYGPNDKADVTKYVRMIYRSSSWGAVPIIGMILHRFGLGWETVPIYRTSYKAAGLLQWEKDMRIGINPEILSALANDDHLKELANTSKSPPWLYMALGVIVGVLLAYFLMQSGAFEWLARQFNPPPSG
jgi:hypothetical protein